jgi:nitronate monooxygenase
MWPNRALIDLFGVELPIIQAPMAGACGSKLAIAVSQAGGIGSLPCALINSEQIRSEMAIIRQHASGPINLNFFCHTPPQGEGLNEDAWRARLAVYYAEAGLEANNVPTKAIQPFNAELCGLVEELKPEIVSCHFGLPDTDLLARLKATGCHLISSATTVAEARWLENNGCDAIIAQGYEAGGHRGVFLTDNVAAQVGTLALVPQVVDAVSIPVIAAGGIADARGIAAAFALGASGVQIGTAYLFTPQALITDLHYDALCKAKDDQTALTNVFSGRPARGLINRIMREAGPISGDVPAFPLAGGALAPLKQQAEAKGRTDFTSLWSGQAASLGRPQCDAGELTRWLAEETLQHLRALAGQNPTP